MEAVAHIRGLTKSYGGPPVLDGFDLTVERGECVGLLGPNGAGKTTTMKLITGQARRTSGQIQVFGLDLPRHSLQVRARLGVVSQDDTLDEELDCFRNLTVYAHFFGMSAARARIRAEGLLEFVQLSDRKQARVYELSGGMRQRLRIARALMPDPDLLLLDEPTTGLDPQARQNIWQKVRELKRTGKTTLLTTHYMDEAEQLCDRLVILDRGQVVARGRPRALIRQHVGKEVLELRADDESPQAVKQRLGLEAFSSEAYGDTLFVYLDEGAAVPAHVWSAPGVEQLHRRASLEDVFLRLTGRELEQ